MSLFTALNREQKEAIGLLQVGTFLEYFDLLLYVHMAVLLNELFFPQSDPHTAALISAFAFSSTFVLRPFGALIFGYIGDNIGRKTTVIITTMMMSTSCIIMANLPTYAQIGITASWIVTLCRVVQGLSSMGEIVGCQVYVTEIIKPPLQHVAVSFIGLAASLGGVAALGIASLVTQTGLNWRIAFGIGAAIAMVGSIARVRLRETPEFVDKKRQLRKEMDDTRLGKASSNFKIKKEKMNGATLAACFLIHCGVPFSFYMAFIYFNPILQRTCGYSPQDIIFHNFMMSIILLLSFIVMTIFCYKFHPLKIIKFKIPFFIAGILMVSLFDSASLNESQVFALQSLLVISCLDSQPADAVLIKHFPVFKRFTATSFVYALSRAVMYPISSFGLVYLTEAFGHWGILVIALPVTFGFMWGVKYFEKLEKASSQATAMPQAPLAA